MLKGVFLIGFFGLSSVFWIFYLFFIQQFTIVIHFFDFYSSS